MSEFILGDCMQGMREYPDKYFDLAIVDPPYDGVTKGGYMRNKGAGGVARIRPKYDITIFSQEPPGEEYFQELRRVSKNQVIWGGNYFTKYLPPSQCWVVWDKVKPPGIKYADCELAWTSFDKGAKLFQFAWNGMIQGNMKQKEKKIHPTQKPVALYRWLLSNLAKEGDLILDTHVGSASSLIACEQMGFEYVGYEIHEGYYNEAVKRLEEERRQIRFEF